MTPNVSTKTSNNIKLKLYLLFMQVVPADYSAPLPETRYDDCDVIGDADVNEKIDR